jgi:SAM-dependent methyltransferase
VPEQEALPEEFIALLEHLERSYLLTDDPIRQSGFGGGPERWREEREPLLDAVDASGDLLDVGCANGYLLECLVEWGRERSLEITPHGLDLGPRLIELARRRIPEHAANMHVGNAWDWVPPRRYRYVYSVHDCVPEAFLERYVARLLADVAEPGGRLIVGAYGSRSRGSAPFDVASFLRSAGHRVAGVSQGGRPPVSAFAWVDVPERSGESE